EGSHHIVAERTTAAARDGAGGWIDEGAGDPDSRGPIWQAGGANRPIAPGRYRLRARDLSFFRGDGRNVHDGRLTAAFLSRFPVICPGRARGLPRLLSVPVGPAALLASCLSQSGLRPSSPLGRRG